MNKSKENLIEYAKAYSEWEDTKKRVIGRMKQVLSRVSEGKIAEIRIQDFDDYSIKFQIFNFNVLVRFTTNVSKDIGCVQWFYVNFNPEKQKTEGKLVLEYYFDHSGSIYKSQTKSNAICNFETTNYWYFIYQNLVEFSKKIDSN